MRALLPFAHWAALFPSIACFPTGPGLFIFSGIDFSITPCAFQTTSKEGLQDEQQRAFACKA